MMGKTIDRFDRKILTELARDGRLSWRDLSQRVGLSETAVVRRVRAMEVAGIISGYGAVVDEARVGRPISVFISISLERQNKGEIEAFEAAIQSSPLIRSCHMMAGDVDFLIRVAVADIEELSGFLDKVLRPIPGMRRISSAFALKNVVDRAGPPIFDE
jgi:Lrp/AsnC family transcriptional regulator, leucine-responsive regulatory protein